jgi:glutamate racemase
LAVIQRACPLFVPLVEEGWFDHPATELVAADYLREFRAAEVRSLVLGCTHYPLLKPLLQRVMGSQVTLIDSGQATASALETILVEKELLAPESAAVGHRFVVSDDEARFRQVGSRFVGERLAGAEVVPLG